MYMLLIDRFLQFKKFFLIVKMFLLFRREIIYVSRLLKLFLQFYILIICKWGLKVQILQNFSREFVAFV